MLSNEDQKLSDRAASAAQHAGAELRAEAWHVALTLSDDPRRRTFLYGAYIVLDAGLEGVSWAPMSADVEDYADRLEAIHERHEADCKARRDAVG